MFGIMAEWAKKSQGLSLAYSKDEAVVLYPEPLLEEADR